MQVSQPNGEVIITNDGATILNKMMVTQPAAKMLVELAKAQARAPARTCTPLSYPEHMRAHGPSPAPAGACGW
jgi:hypothetical protein